MREDWKYERLLDACDVYQPATISTKQLVEDGDFDVFGANGKIGKYSSYNHEESEVLLTCRGATCGNINVSTPKSWINGNAMVVHPKDKNLLKNYLVYLLKTINYAEVITGSAQPQITRLSLKNVHIPVPPLTEQERIVAYLDDGFAKIDALKANAASQLQAAKDLFQSALKELLTPKEGWDESIITSIVRNDCSLSYGIVQPGDGVDCGVPVVRPVDITNRIYVGKDGLKKTTEQISNAYKRTILTGDEILLCVRGTTGLVAIASRELEGCNVTRGIVPIRLINRINKKFIYYTFLTPAVQNEFARITTGSTLKQINIKDLRELTIPIPSLPEQERIAARLDAISEKVKALQENYNKTLVLCNDLKQSLLKSIFE